MISNFTVFIFMIGIFILFLAFVIGTQGCADMLNGFNKNKYDEKKASKIITRALLFSGGIMILIGIISLFSSSTYLNLNISIQVILMIIIAIIILLMCYQLDKYAKIKK